MIPRVSASDHAMAHFEPDGRITFLIPWGSRNHLTLVGTTDEDHREGPDHVHITDGERDYLLGIVYNCFLGLPSSAHLGFQFLAASNSRTGRIGDSATREHRSGTRRMEFFTSPAASIHLPAHERGG